ncbi:MAG TPA: dephospho-CoA kinase [Acidobacteriaceae bacterium]|jgi:dephospho-CoA kinase|nr:dephospho-CoA kinase [Acidobacteriaceae bacterium]
MLRVGLTGGLGSGKSTAAQRFAELGAVVFSADEIGRVMMQPREPVFAAIVAHFGAGVVSPDGSLNRSALARLVFGGGEKDAGRLEELNAIVHPAVIARQKELMDEVAARDANAVAIVESALIFETKFGGEGGWHQRFDRLIFVKAAEELRIARFVERASGGKTLSREERRALEDEARRRIARQSETERNIVSCDCVLTNDGSTEQLLAQVDALWPALKAAAMQRV